MANSTITNTTPSAPSTSTSPSSTPNNLSATHQQIQHHGRLLIATLTKTAQCNANWIDLATKHQEQINQYRKYSTYHPYGRSALPISVRLKLLSDQILDLEEKEAEAAVELLRWHAKAVMGRFLPIEILRMVVEVLYPWARQLPYAAVGAGGEGAGGSVVEGEDSGGEEDGGGVAGVGESAEKNTEGVESGVGGDLVGYEYEVADMQECVELG